MNTLEFIEYACEHYPELFLSNACLKKISTKKGHSAEFYISKTIDRYQQDFKETIMFLLGLKTDLLIDFLEEYYPILILHRKTYQARLYRLDTLVNRLTKLNIIPNINDMYIRAKYHYKYDIKLKELPNYKTYDVIDNIYSEIDNTEVFIENVKMLYRLYKKNALEKHQKKLNKLFYKHNLNTTLMKEANKFLTGEEVTIENFLQCVNFVALCAGEKLRESLRKITLQEIVSNMDFDQYEAMHFQVLAQICTARKCVLQDNLQINWR